MKRVGTVLISMAVVAALLAIPLGVSAATSDHTESTTAGEQLGGVIGVQGAAVDGELADRTFGQQLDNADSDEARAELIAERLNETAQQNENREARLAALEAQREEGEISEGRYNAQVAMLEAERANTERQTDRAGEAARGLPEDVLADRGVDVDRIDEIRTNASRLGGPETSDRAREIAGENVSQPIADDRGERPGAEQSTADREQSDQDRQNRTDDTRQGGSADQSSPDERTTDQRGNNSSESQNDNRGSADNRPS